MTEHHVGPDPEVNVGPDSTPNPIPANQGSSMTTTKPPMLTEARTDFETWAVGILGDNPTWRESAPCELAWQAWQAVLERAGADAWQPIETAPKQGMILLGRPAEGEGDDRSDAICTPGYWQEGWEDSIDDMGCDDGFVDVQHDQFSPPRTFGAEKYRTAGAQPTHWMPLPAGPGALKVTPAAAVADDESKALDLLATLFDAYEKGPTCYEDTDDCAGYLGNAVRLGNDDFQACAELLNRRRPRQDAIAAAHQAGQLSGNAGEVDAVDAERYRMVRRGQRWSVIDGIGNDLRGDALDSAADAAIAASKGANHG